MTEGRLSVVRVAYWLYLGFVVSFLLKALAWWGWTWTLVALVVLAVPAELLGRFLRRASVAKDGSSQKSKEAGKELLR